MKTVRSEVGLGIGRLMFARVKGMGILPGILVERLAELTVAPSCAVLC